MKRVTPALLLLGVIAYVAAVALTLNTQHARTYVDPFDEKDLVARVLQSEVCTGKGQNARLELVDRAAYPAWQRALLLDARRNIFVSHRILERPECLASMASALSEPKVPTFVTVRNFGTGADLLEIRGR